MSQLDAAHFERTAQLKDSDLDITAVITTEQGFRYRGGFTDRVRADNFLRAIVSKGSGVTQIQLYQTITYTGPWRHFVSANFQTPSGLQRAELVPIHEAVPGCDTVLCVHEDDVAFEVPEKTLRQIAAAYERGNRQMWRFKFTALADEDWEDSMSPAEIAGLLRRLDSYRSSHK